MLKHAEPYAVKLPIKSPSLITGILLSQNRDILRGGNVVVVVPEKPNFSHKIFEGKHAPDIVRPSCGSYVGVELGTDDEVLDVAPLYGHVRSEIIDISTRWKAMCEG